jgi:hypothetical protein
MLEFASDQFLDLAIMRRIKAANTRDLVNPMAKAEWLGFSEMNVGNDAFHRSEHRRLCMDPIARSISLDRV